VARKGDEHEPAERGGFTGAVFGGVGLLPGATGGSVRSAEQMRLLNALCLFVEMGGRRRESMTHENGATDN
jgi:hypothetical protein